MSTNGASWCAHVAAGGEQAPVVRVRPEGPGHTVSIHWCGPGGATVTASWRAKPLGTPRDPVAWRICDLAVGVHDPVAHRDGDLVGAVRCGALGGRPCFWRSGDGMGVLVAYLEDDQVRLSAAMAELARAPGSSRN